MDEIFWALYDRDEEEKIEDEAMLNPTVSSNLHLALGSS